MTVTPQIAMARIARQLKTAEGQADKALLEFSRLMAELVEARQATGVVPHTGQEALIRLARAQVSLIDSSSDLFRVHNVMSKVGREQGILDEPGSTPRFGLIEDEPAVAAQA